MYSCFPEEKPSAYWDQVQSEIWKSVWLFTYVFISHRTKNTNPDLVVTSLLTERWGFSRIYVKSESENESIKLAVPSVAISQKKITGTFPWAQ